MLDGGGNYATMVLPVLEGDKQFALLSFCSVSGNRPTEERKMYPLFASVKVSYPEKQVVWKDVHEGDFGLTSPLRDEGKEPYLGVVDRSGLVSGEWANAKRRYTPLVSLVMEKRWLLTQHTVTAEECATAKELQDCVRILYDKPLLPYYQHAGRQFLSWMERAAK